MPRKRLEPPLPPTDDFEFDYFSTVRPSKAKPPPEREPITANNPHELLTVLGLDQAGTDLLTAGLFAFAARNPGQAKKLDEVWHEAFYEAGADYTPEQWAEVVRVGELIASHRWVKTPAYPRG